MSPNESQRDPSPILALQVAVAVLALAIGLYVPSFDSPFQFDDALFLQDGNVRAGRWQEFVWPPQPRFLTWLSLLGQHRLHGPDPVPFHVFNAVVHGLNGVLAFWALSALLMRGGGGRSRPNSRSAPLGLALFGALIFALHPLQSEAVIYVYQRSTLMGSFFAFLALLVWIKRPKGGSNWRGGAALALFLLALGCKEAFVSLPAALWMYDGVVRRQWRPSRWLLGMLAVSGVVGFGYLHWGEVRLGAGLLYAVTEVKVWLRYFLLVLGIASQSVDHAVAPQTTLLNSAFWWTLIGMTALAVLAWRRRRDHPAATFSALWLALLLAPTSSFIPSPDFMFEHRMYAPMLGVSGLAATALGTLIERTRDFRNVPSWLWTSAAAAVLVLCAAANLNRQKVWSSPRALWMDAAAKAPEKYRPNFNLGVVLMDESPQLAERFLTRAVQLAPSVPLAYRSLGKLKFDAGDLEAAEKFWGQALLLDPSDAESLTGLGVIDARRRDYAAAAEKFQAASRLSPHSPEPHLQLSRLNLRFGFVEKAIEAAEAGLQHSPADARLLFALADSVSQSANWSRAVEIYRKGLQRDPEDASAWIGLGRALLELGRPEEAAAAAQRGLEASEDASLRDRARRLLDHIGHPPPR